MLVLRRARVLSRRALPDCGVPSGKPVAPGRASGPGARPGAGGSGPGDGRVRHLVTDVGWGACGAVVRPSLGVPVGGRIAGPGPRRPESRGVTLPAQRQTRPWSGAAV